MNVKQCPFCKEYNAHKTLCQPLLTGNDTEVKVAMFCPDCGFNWWIIYVPNEIRERK